MKKFEKKESRVEFEVGSPHDAAFKSAFQKKYLARNLIRSYLPADITKHIDFRHLALVNKSYVDEKLREKHSDIVYRTKLRGMTALLYFLFEHQSSSDQMMSFRTLSYEDNIWKEYLDQNPEKKKLPVIIPVVLHNGKTKWTAPLNFKEIVEGGDVFSEYLPDFRYELIDLSKYEDESLVGDIALRFVLYTFKHIYDGDLDGAFRLAGDFLTELQKLPTFLELYEWFLRYVYHARTDEKKKLTKMIDSVSARLTAKEVKEMAMTVAEQIKKEGKKEGKEETAANLLKLGIDVKTIILATGLTEKEIKRLAGH
ncbi:MAG: Rpn family recombination-promoting nuclease/putative transposase [Desulfobacteraceae bacterium]|nr:Rpn family recombination-promoting nuclease/putative transposase [Desulfobacteraceae bacterium]